MKFQEVFRFELKYQLRNVLTWIYLAISFLFPIGLSITGTQPVGETTNLNAPSFLIFVTIFVSIIWLLTSGAIAGHAAARDIQTRMHPLIYTAPVSKLEYLGGRFLAAFFLNSFIQLATPLGFFLSFYTPGMKFSPLGPFLPEGYLTTYFYISLPVTFVVTAFQFSVAVLERRAIAAYIGSILVFPIISHFIGLTTASLSGNWDLWKLIDLAGISIIADIETWTPVQKNTRLIKLEGMMLLNRLMWLGVALGFLTYTYHRFHFSHPIESSWWSRLKRKKKASAHTVNEKVAHTTISIPQINPTFGFATHIRQIRAIAWSSFRMIAKSKAGLSIIILFALQLIVFRQGYMDFRGVPQFPTTMKILTILTASLRDIASPLIIIPLLIVFYAGELIWREREAGVNRISDTFPTAEWVLFLGKLGGLSLIIIVWLGILMMGGILTQVAMGYTNFEVGAYLKALFGFQLINYLLFALLVLVVHVLVNQKYLGHLVILMVYLSIVFASKLGIEHNLLIYASDPGWSYTDMRGFEPYLAPWLWFKLYWVGWAVLLAVAARLFWVRSMSQGLNSRIQLLRQRFTHATVWTAGVAVGLVLIAGSYIFYNTNVLNDYTAASDRTEKLARYEQNYRKYEAVPQPQLAGTKLHVEIYPKQRKADIRGTYKLINRTQVPIDTIHLATISGIETGAVKFDRPAASVLEDKYLGHSIYKLQTPLQPGDSLNLSFEVHYHPQGFPNKGIDASVIANGTYFINYDWLPAIGYQANRELRNIGDRKKHALAPKVNPSPYDTKANKIMPGQELITFEAVVGTDEGQIAITAGEQLRQWKENGRNYFQYATSAPIRNTYSFFSGKYATHLAKWNNTDIRVYYHPEHAQNIDRVVQSTKAALTYFSKKFRSYPYKHLTIIERSGYEGALNAEPTTIDYGESFTLSNQRDNPSSLDITYFAIAHEVAHQWWGAAQLMPAHVEGGILISETLANYSGLKVLEEAYGIKQVRQLLSMWRDSYEVPRARATSPLLQATDSFLGYRKGPLALYALTQYIDKEGVNNALRQLLEKHGSGKPPLPTSLDFYRELKAVTPDSLKYLLHDYFEKNIYWQFKTEQATAKQIDSTTWQVTLSVEAKKVVIDSNGTEIAVPMNDWVEIGVFAPWEKGETSGKALYLQKHRIRSGKQTITVTVHGKPSRGGIDPYYLLIDLDLDNNTKRINMEGMDKGEPDLI